MKRFKVSVILTIVMVMLMQVILPTVSYAVDAIPTRSGNASIKLNIQSERPFDDDDGNGTVGDDIYTVTRAATQTVFKIGEQDEEGNLSFETAYYCLRAGLGFGDGTAIVEEGVNYTEYANLTNASAVKNYYSTVGHQITDNNYKAICWIADNMYLPKSPYKDDLKAKLLSKAGITNSQLTDDDIEVVQQIALWYFTNYDENGQSNSLSLADTVDVSNLLKIHGYEASNNEDAKFNKTRAGQIDTLYKYLVGTAKTEAPTYEVNKTVLAESLELDDTLNPTIEEKTINSRTEVRVVGPFKITELQQRTTEDFTFSYELKYKKAKDQTEWSTLAIDNTYGRVYLSDANGNELGDGDKIVDDMIGKGEFYVTVLKSYLGSSDITDFKLVINYDSPYYVTTGTVLTAGENDQAVLKVEKERITNPQEDEITVTKEIEVKEFDLSLRKFISNIKRNGENVELESREPDVYTDTLQNGGTATYVHPKNELTLQKGDVITYTIRIYNEGDIDGTATEVTDYLPEGLIFLSDNETNLNYGWIAEGQTIKTTYLADNNIVIPGYDKDEGRPELPSNSFVKWQQAEGTTDGLYYVDLPVVCRISDTVEAGTSLRNIAEITADNGDDRDSTPGNTDRDNYTPGENNSTYQEDDDDYERVKVEEFFDLSLRKYISSVKTGGETTTFEDAGTRTPNVDTTRLNTVDITTAEYKHRKDPVVVETGSLVNYKLVIYNEGDVAGRATKVIDQLPAGLRFVQVISGDFEEESYNEETNTLTLVREERNEYNLTPFDGTTLDSETIEIQCEVTAVPDENNQKILTNIAWIAEYYNDTGLPDRDSNENTPTMPDLVTEDIGYTNNSNEELDNPSSYFEGQQDDDDFEKVVINPINGLYDIVLVKEDARGEQLEDTATFEVDGVEKQVTGRLIIVENKKITPTTVGTVDTYIIKETVPPDKYCAFDGTIKVEVYKKKDGDKYVVDYIKYYVDDVEVMENRRDLNVYLNTNGNIYVEVKDYQFDLALRKFITSVNGNPAEPSREPVVDVSTLINGRTNEAGKTEYTATYTHPKAPIVVETNDTVVYTIRVYNEGEVAGTATEVKDYLPEGLEFVQESDINDSYGWIASEENGRTVVRTSYLANKTIPAFDGTTLNYLDLQIECKVIATISSNDQTLRNIAAITGDNGDDRDSEPTTPDLDNYNPSGDNSTYQEDDDDYEDLVLPTQKFDLSLRKFISDIERNGTAVEIASREPELDTTTLQTGTTATYVHSKEPLTVKQGDIITYTIRVYNEGELDGYAEEITDYLPSGLGFLMGYEGNENWRIVESENIQTKTIDGLDSVTVVYAKDGENLAITNSSLKEDVLKENLIKKYSAEVEEGDLWQQSTNDQNDGLFYKEVEVKCVVLAPNTYEGILKNIAEISQDKAVDDFGTEVEIDDRDSDVDNVLEDEEHTPGTEVEGYTPGEQDDDDFEPIALKYFDLALRKFITGVNDKEVTSRVPEFYIDEDGNYKYEHSKEPVEVVDKDTVIYTIRVFNEGTIEGYAEEIEDDIPEGLVFLPENELNKEYRWQMFRPAEEDEDLEGKTTIIRNNKILVEVDKDNEEDVKKATIIRTDYLSKAQGEARMTEEDTKNPNLLEAFDKEKYNSHEIESPDYKDVKVAFKVSQSDIPEENEDRVIINKAHITKDSDDDEDSTPDKWNDEDDDQDIEKIYVKEFDLALYKWVTKTIVTVDGKTTETETGFNPNVGKTEGSGENYRENSEVEPIASVTIDKKKLSKTVVKFAYNIKVVNEGDIAGSATEIIDYIPEGLDFIAEDNPLWTIGEKDGTITTRALETIVLEPGQSAIVPVVFTWKNDANNLGLKTNVAAITEDYNDNGVEDTDSTPGNEVITEYDKEQEDDDDFALVILTLKTGTEIKYIGLMLAVITILALGTVSIKKYVL